MADTAEGTGYDISAIDISGGESAGEEPVTETAAEATPGAAAEGQQAAGTGTASWLTVLSKGMRDSVENPEQFATVSDYIAYLQNELKSKESSNADAAKAEEKAGFDEAWEQYAASVGEGSKDEQDRKSKSALLEVFRSQDIPADKAQKVLEAVSKMGAEQQALAEEARKQELKAYTSSWGKTEAARKAVLSEYDRGMRAIQKSNPALFEGLVRQGLHTTPQVMDLVLMLTRASGEVPPPSGKSAGSNRRTVSRYNLTF